METHLFGKEYVIQGKFYKRDYTIRLGMTTTRAIEDPWMRSIKDYKPKLLQNLAYNYANIKV